MVCYVNHKSACRPEHDFLLCCILPSLATDRGLGTPSLQMSTPRGKKKTNYHHEILFKHWHILSPSFWLVWRSPCRSSGTFLKLAIKSQLKHDCCCWRKSTETVVWLCSSNLRHTHFLLPQFLPSCSISTALRDSSGSLLANWLVFNWQRGTW